MTKLENARKAVEQLSGDELTAFQRWFEEMRARQWDDQIERDAKAGKLDWLAEEALAEHRSGRSVKLK